jgi:phosphate transport system substrate-binding protein
MKHNFSMPLCLRGSLVGALFLAATVPAWALDISGASTVQPVVEKLIPLWTAQGGEAVKLAGGGSGAGIKDATSGKSQIGMVSRDLKDEEKAALKNKVIAIDALAIVVNKGNSIAGLSKAQLVDLYTGKIDNWKAVGGPDLPVIRVSKEVGRSTLELFEHYTGLLSPDRNKTDKPLISKQTYVIGSNLESLTLVGGMPGAIGYVSVGTARALAQVGMPVKILALDGIEPSDEAIRGKRWPIVRPLNLVYTQETPAVSAFLALALDAKGQDVVKSLGLLPVGP